MPEDYTIAPDYVERGESPYAAAARETTEELGITLAPGRLLTVDWTPARAGLSDGVVMIFDGGVMPAAAAAAITVPVDELHGVEFRALDDARPLLTTRSARRVAAAVEARATGTVAYLDNGVPPGSDPALR